MLYGSTGWSRPLGFILKNCRIPYGVSRPLGFILKNCRIPYGVSRHSDALWFHGVEQAFRPAVKLLSLRLQPLR
jgi:hypothetical protein